MSGKSGKLRHYIHRNTSTASWAAKGNLGGNESTLSKHLSSFPSDHFPSQNISLLIGTVSPSYVPKHLHIKTCTVHFPLPLFPSLFQQHGLLTLGSQPTRNFTRSINPLKLHAKLCA